MKTLRLFLLATSVLLLNTTYAQTIRRVNNNPGVTGVNVYTTAQAAHDAAVANDILIIEPSVTSYGDLMLTKPLEIYGNGYFLNVNTELKADQRSSILGTVVLAAGSSGCSFYGIVSYSIFSNRVGSTPYAVNNITIDRCYFTTISFLNPYNGGGQGTANLSNISILRSYIDALQLSPLSPATITSVSIQNNIIRSITNGGTVGVGFEGIVRNNTIYGQAAGSTILFSNSAIENNLLSSGGLIPSFNSTLSNNVSSTDSFTGGVGNQNNFNVASALIGTGAGISTDESYQLKAGSSLKTAGSGGIEVGAYGGTTPYVVSGIPAIPSITSMNYTSTGSNSLPLQVTISVKSNN